MIRSNYHYCARVSISVFHFFFHIRSISISISISISCFPHAQNRVPPDNPHWSEINTSELIINHMWNWPGVTVYLWMCKYSWICQEAANTITSGIVMATHTVTIATVSQIHTAGIGACGGGSSSCPLNRQRTVYYMHLLYYTMPDLLPNLHYGMSHHMLAWNRVVSSQTQQHGAQCRRTQRGVS